MSDFARTVATEMIAAQGRFTDWQLEQSKAAQANVVAGFDAVRSVAQLQRDLVAALGKAVL